jgi:hypothetical protein
VVVYGIYFGILIPRLTADPLHAQPYLELLFTCVFCLVVLQIILQTALAIALRDEARQPRDERERLIGMKSDRVAMVVMAATIGCLWWAYVAGPAFIANTAILANVVLFGLVLAAIAKYTSAIVYFHRGA